MGKKAFLKMLRRESRDVTDDVDEQKRIYADKRKRFGDTPPQGGPQNPRIDVPKQNQRPLDAMYPATYPKYYFLKVATHNAIRDLGNEHVVLNYHPQVMERLAVFG